MTPQPDPALYPLVVPNWVKDAVFYQIFPDRYANGNPDIDPEGVVPWDSEPTRGNFFGGDFAGITAHLDHIVELGANAIYLTPIFEADTNHRYDSADYFRIDHRLGDLGDFRRFVAAAHDRGIRVVLDAVFNHCGEGHWAFRHLHSHGAESPYAEWFTYETLPLVREPVANYATCEGCKYLPKLNHENPEVREYLLDVGTHWLGEGIDGWRLDMPFLMPHDFWREFRRRIKATSDDLYIVAEVWEEATEWLQGDMADGAMNYPLRSLILDFATRKDEPSVTATRLADLYDATPEPARVGMLNLLGSHDTARLRTLLNGDREAELIAIALLLTSPGAPMVYYGDEVGVEGGGDPGCRASMPWDEQRWDADLLAWYRTWIALRHAHSALRGSDDCVMADTGPLLVRRRSDGNHTVWLVINHTHAVAYLETETVSGACRDLVSGMAVRRSEQGLVIPAGAVLLLAESSGS